MNDLFDEFDHKLEQLTDEFEILNLILIHRNGSSDYWERLARLSFFKKLYDGYGYHFLYEIQGLSSQIHFGLLNCILFKDKISLEPGRPNAYNHRYTFMIESTIHGIYSYWNRTALLLNTYLKVPKDIKRIYFASVVAQLEIDFPNLKNDKNFQWLCDVKKALDDLERNEFAHNNSLIMQNFLSKEKGGGDFQNLLDLPEILLSHNKLIVNEINRFVELIETFERI